MANWENGDVVTSTIQTNNLYEYCTVPKESTIHHPLKSGEEKWVPRPYGSPTCGHFAVLHRPEVNRWIYRGCNFSKCKKTQDGKLDCTMSDDNPDFVCDLDGLCGNHGFNIGNTMDPAVYRACNNDVPGGLVDPRADMDSFSKTNLGNEQYLKNGFMMDSCECQVKAQFAEMCSSGKKILTGGGTTDSGNFRYTPCEGTYCDKYSEYGKKYPSKIRYNELYWNGDLAGEVWSGQGGCKSSANADVNTFKIKYPNDSFLLKNTCGLYIDKWAKTCKWCQDQKGSVPSPDKGFLCTDDIDCYGSCLILPDELQNPKIMESLNGKKYGFCIGRMNMECNICNADIWKHVPGGWQAVIDPNNPLHELAKLSYVAKTQEINPETLGCNNAAIDVLDYNNTKLKREDTNAAESTTFVDAGPYQARKNYSIISDSISYTKDGCAMSGTWNGDLGDSYGTKSWNNNTRQNVCKSCSELVWNDPGSVGSNVWLNNINPAISSLDIKSCEIKKNYVGTWPIYKDINDPDVPDSTRILCERNPQITGYGKYEIDPTNPTKSNYHIAMNWIKGKPDLSEYIPGYNKEKIIFSTEDINNHVIEALRCCNGLTPGDGKTRDDCIPASTCPSSKFCTDLISMTIKDELPGNLKFDIYKFANKYPIINDKPFNPTTDFVKDPAIYAKMYCELMSGGSSPDGVVNTHQGNKGYDTKINTLCRKALYNYAVEPVEVDNLKKTDPSSAQTDYLLDSYKLPLRIFDDTVYNWCRGDLLKDVTPNQYGVCDMLLGRTCQQLQVDGWIDEKNTSPILTAFVDGSGNWVEKGYPDRVHTGVTAEKIRQTCGCFLLGSQCNDKDCSYFYCGAGKDDGLGPDKVNYDDLTSSPIANKTNQLSNQVSLAAYGKQGTLPGWKKNVTPEFRCEDGNKKSNCFTGCNYVNYYDICWNAGPENRKVNIPRDLNKWGCKPTDNGNSCMNRGVEGFSETLFPAEHFGSETLFPAEHFGSETSNYTCFGVCPVDYVGFPNCGTETWFNKKTKPLNLTPNEKERASIHMTPNDVDYPTWQNFYTYDASVNTGVKAIRIPGWSSNIMLGRGGEGLRACNYAGCKDDSIRPYGIPSTASCGSSCNLSQIGTSLNNGTISAGSIIFTNDSKNACQFSSAWSSSAYNAKNKEQQSLFMQYMGSNDKCYGITDAKGKQVCEDSSKICINTGSGDNCQKCPDQNGNCTGENCAASSKSHICCTTDTIFYGNELGCYSSNPLNIDDTNRCKEFKNETECETNSCLWTIPQGSHCYSKNPFNDGDVERCTKLKTETDCKKDAYCLWTTTWDNDNKSIRSLLSNNITYMCQSSCPSGTTDLLNYQEAKCGGLCEDISDENTCTNNPCGVCIWINEPPSTTSAPTPKSSLSPTSKPKNSGKCFATCPLASKNAIVVNVPQQPEPTIGPTVGPTVAPTPAPSFWNNENNPFRNLSPELQVTVYVFIFIAFILLFVGIGYLIKYIKAKYLTK